MDHSETVVKTDRVGKTYGKFRAVSDLSMEVKRGEIYALVGQNGAGKTTLLKLISGLSPASSGGLELFGQNSARGLEWARAHTGSMIETPGFFPYLSARRNLEYYCIQRGIKDAGRVGRALDFVGLSGAGTKKFKNFSLGMKQRLGLALAVIGDPQLLFLDEPINGLDPMGIAEFRQLILKLNREKEVTVVISSHILGELSQIATTYGFIHKGELVEHVSAAELAEKCRSCLKLDVDDAERAAAVLKDALSCEKVEITGKTSLLVDEKLDTPEVLVKALVENGVMVSQAYRSGITLEKYFIDLIGGKQDA